MSRTTEALPRGAATRNWGLLLLTSFFLLLALQLHDAWIRQAPPIVWVLWVAPLLILVPGLFRDSLRTVAWLSFVSLLYFLLVVPRVFAESDSLRTWLELATVVVLFLSSMFYLRCRGRELRDRAAEQTED